MMLYTVCYSKMHKLIVAGNRTFTDWEFFTSVMNSINFSRIQIVEGGAEGVDEMAKRYAVINNISFRTFDAEWKIYGKAAGPIRNKQMAEYADGLLAFWDGKSKGTQNMIETAKKLKLKVKVISL